METQIKDGLYLVKYQDNWYYNDEGYWRLWVEIPDNINWNVSKPLSGNKKMIFKIPVGNLSRKKADEVINLLRSCWFPDNEDQKLQIKINKFVRKEKLKQINERCT